MKSRTKCHSIFKILQHSKRKKERIYINIYKQYIMLSYHDNCLTIITIFRTMIGFTTLLIFLSISHIFQTLSAQ